MYDGVTDLRDNMLLSEVRRELCHRSHGDGQREKTPIQKMQMGESHKSGSGGESML